MEKTEGLIGSESETELENGQTIDSPTGLRYKLPRGLLVLASALVLGIFAVWALGQQPSKHVTDTIDNRGIIEEHEAVVTVFINSKTSNMEIKKQQQKIHMVLTGKKIAYQNVDISSSTKAKNKMRELAGAPEALPPQISNGDQYCGDYSDFDNAVENEKLAEFLKLS